MRFRVVFVTFLFLAALLVSSPALAQQRHVVTPSDMRQAVAQSAEARQQTRETLRTVLKDSQVRAVAARLGLSVTRADSAIATLSGAELDQLAAPARELSTQLAGGASTIVISTTTALLILIIVILLID
jgi:hypothetical protein